MTLQVALVESLRGHTSRGQVGSQLLNVLWSLGKAAVDDPSGGDGLPQRALWKAEVVRFALPPRPLGAPGRAL